MDQKYLYLSLFKYFNPTKFTSISELEKKRIFSLIILVNTVLPDMKHLLPTYRIAI